ncbi:hypothetical protein Tco_1263874 [Tanacetum coccineum]
MVSQKMKSSAKTFDCSRSSLGLHSYDVCSHQFRPQEMHEMHKNYINREGDHASKNDDTPMCERQEANSIQSQELNKDVKNDLEDFKSCIRSMRTVH